MPPRVVTATLQSALLTLLSCLIARTFTASDPPIVPLVIVSLFNTPPNYYWQQLIEYYFPGYTTTKIEVDDGGKGVEVEKKLNIRNTAVKFVLDQTIGAVWNVGWFLGLTRWLQGVPLGECLIAVREEMWSLMVAGYKLWPAVCLVQHTLIPAEQRTLVGSLVGLGWNVYLAMQAST